MKASLLIGLALVVAGNPSWAGDEESRFVEFHEERNTTTYDTNTVEMIAPGRFTIIQTTIDVPDVMKLELKVFAILQTFCNRPDGKYPAPTEMFVLGAPDLPVNDIEVKTSPVKTIGKSYLYKAVSWDYPYRRLAINAQSGLIQYFHVVPCKDQLQTQSEYRSEIEEGRSVIMNGTRTKELFDCKRGQMGIFIGHEDDDASKAKTYFVGPDTRGFRYYLGVCYRVTHEQPYEPK